LYTVIVCRYIMFWAKTRPVCVATTDFGEMEPRMTARRRRRSVSEAGATGVGEGVGGGLTVGAGLGLGEGSADGLALGEGSAVGVGAGLMPGEGSADVAAVGSTDGSADVAGWAVGSPEDASARAPAVPARDTGASPANATTPMTTASVDARIERREACITKASWVLRGSLGKAGRTARS
jgi:hypothetical protein